MHFTARRIHPEKRGYQQLRGLASLASRRGRAVTIFSHYLRRQSCSGGEEWRHGVEDRPRIQLRGLRGAD